MFFGIQLRLICVVLFQGGPGGGGGRPPLEACTCLMVDGTQSCATAFGAWPGPNPSKIICDTKICDATTPPTCNKPAPNTWRENMSPAQWATEHIKYKVPGAGEQGMQRKQTTGWVCTVDYTCNDCEWFGDKSPAGYYCTPTYVSVNRLQLYGLCTNAQVCNGEGGTY